MNCDKFVQRALDYIEDINGGDVFMPKDSGTKSQQLVTNKAVKAGLPSVSKENEGSNKNYCFDISLLIMVNFSCFILQYGL